MSEVEIQAQASDSKLTLDLSSEDDKLSASSNSPTKDISSPDGAQEPLSPRTSSSSLKSPKLEPAPPPSKNPWNKLKSTNGEEIVLTVKRDQTVVFSYR